MTEDNLLYKKQDRYLISELREAEIKDVTYIVGARCKDGIVLVGDRKITLEDGTDYAYEDKLFNDFSPVVVGSSGVAGLFDMFRNRVGSYVAEHQGQIGIQPFIEAIADMTKEINDRWSPRTHARFDVLLGIQLAPISALLYIYPWGFPETVRRYQAIGHGAPYGSIFLKKLWDSNMTMEQFAELGYLIIRQIDKLQLDSSVGGIPQIWFIPNPKEHVAEEEKAKYAVHQAEQKMVEEFEKKANERIAKYEVNLKQLLL